jgi:ribonuclease HII
MPDVKEINMPWVIGCDEAGYGPPLGCFTQASVAIKLPETMDSVENTWSAFPDIFRRRKGAAKARPGDLPLVIDDSKLMTQLDSGLPHMATLWPCLFQLPIPFPETLDSFLNWAHLPHEKTYLEDPTFNPRKTITWGVEEQQRLLIKDKLATAGLGHGIAKISMVSPSFFNKIINKTLNKSSVLELGWKGHICWWLNELPGDDPLVIISDRLGGKKSYTSLFQETLQGNGIVQVIAENNEGATYKVMGARREILLMVRTKADFRYLPVAAASMLAKHLREISMEMVNEFWQTLQPGIKPTAGYPEDGKRFYDEIKHLLPKHQIKESSVWRQR